MKYDYSELKGKVCAITGGAGVIGTSLAKGMVEAGINVAIVTGRISRAVEHRAADLGIKILFQKDLT